MLSIIMPPSKIFELCVVKSCFLTNHEMNGAKQLITNYSLGHYKHSLLQFAAHAYDVSRLFPRLDTNLLQLPR